MKKTLLICALAVSVAGCADHRRDNYVVGYEYVPAHTTYETSCPRCQKQQPGAIYSYTTYTECTQVQPKPEPKPQVQNAWVLMPAQVVIEQEPEIVYQPQPSCGCKKCGCQKKSAKK